MATLKGIIAPIITCYRGRTCIYKHRTSTQLGVCMRSVKAVGVCVRACVHTCECVLESMTHCTAHCSVRLWAWIRLDQCRAPVGWGWEGRHLQSEGEQGKALFPVSLPLSHSNTGHDCQRWPQHCPAALSDMTSQRERRRELEIMCLVLSSIVLFHLLQSKLGS